MRYDQLTLSQWVQGFCKNSIEESDLGEQNQMITDMEYLMQVTADFGWPRAKVTYSGLCCELERITVTWCDTDQRK